MAPAERTPTQVWDVVLSNIKLVKSIAFRLAWDEFNRDDYISEGILGLREAAAEYIPGKAAFSTFAYSTVRNAIWRYMNRLRRHGCERLPDDYANEVVKDYDDDEVLKLDILISKLPQREQIILKSCYGIGSDPVHLKQVAKNLGLAYSTVRGIKYRTIQHLSAQMRKSCSPLSQ